MPDSTLEPRPEPGRGPEHDWAAVVAPHLHRRWRWCCERHAQHGPAGDRGWWFVDLDGTLSEVAWARRWVDPEHPHWRQRGVHRPTDRRGRFPRRFDRFQQEAAAAPLRPEVVALVHALHAAGASIAIVSGRSARYQRASEATLVHNAVPFDDVRMRPVDDLRADHILKAEILAQFVEAAGALPAGAIDDRRDIADVWCAADVATVIVDTTSALLAPPA